MSDYFREAFGDQGSPGEPIDGGPAFPIKEHLDSDWPGMTLRDYLAAKAMPACLEKAFSEEDEDGLDWVIDKSAIWAYMAADAMLKARGN